MIAKDFKSQTVKFTRTLCTASVCMLSFSCSNSPSEKGLTRVTTPEITVVGSRDSQGAASSVSQSTAGLKLVSMKGVFEGSKAKSDALFTFYIQRSSPAAENSKRELVRALGKGESSSGDVANSCVCGQKNKFLFYWEHKNGGRGALHSPTYNTTREIQGDWIVASRVDGTGGSGHASWYSGRLAEIPQGINSMFFGADSQNPTSILATNPEGKGFLRTWHYHPDNPLGGNAKQWSTRQELRIGATCMVSACPQELQSGTEIEFEMHSSHRPEWRQP
jgi:hypothetical protein